MAIKICVIGAGISGSSTAYRLLLKHPECNVTILSKDLSPNTTGDGAAGFWEPVFVPGSSPEFIKRVSKETLEYTLETLKNDPDSSQHGMFVVHGYNLFTTPISQGRPSWADDILDFHVLEEREIRSRFPDYVKSGYKFTTVITEGRRVIPYYLKRVEELGGKVIQKSVSSIEEISEDFDIIVNCSGLGSRDLFNDDNMRSIRGQIVRVEAPWIKEFVICESDHDVSYVLPNQEFLVVGGTAEESSNNQVSLEERESMMNRAKTLLPHLQNAKIIQDWVGFRPLRVNGVRVEKEDHQLKNENKFVKVVHNYGHGGSGITIHWGCAGDAVKLISESINELKTLK